jgi:hypothetical protein
LPRPLHDYHLDRNHFFLSKITTRKKSKRIRSTNPINKTNSHSVYDDVGPLKRSEESAFSSLHSSARHPPYEAVCKIEKFDALPHVRLVPLLAPLGRCALCAFVLSRGS